MSKYTPTAPETDDLQKLLDAATPGPWVAEEKTGPASEWARSNLGVWSEHRLTLSTTADDGDDPMDDAWLCGIWGQLSEDDFANARLIALAPDLARRVIAAEKLAEALRVVCQHGRIDDSESRMNMCGAALAEWDATQ